MGKGEGKEGVKGARKERGKELKGTRKEGVEGPGEEGGGDGLSQNQDQHCRTRRLIRPRVFLAVRRGFFPTPR